MQSRPLSLLSWQVRTPAGSAINLQLGEHGMSLNFSGLLLPLFQLISGDVLHVRVCHHMQFSRSSDFVNNYRNLLLTLAIVLIYLVFISFLG